MDTFSYLKSHPLLFGFTDDGVKIIQAATTLREVPAATPIFIERMQGESAFLLVDGEVGLAFSDGEEMSMLQSPSHFGELALLAPGPRRLSAKARTNCVLLEINRRDFQNLMKQRPQACAKFLMNVAQAVGERVTAASSTLEQLLRTA